MVRIPDAFVQTDKNVNTLKHFVFICLYWWFIFLMCWLNVEIPPLDALNGSLLLQIDASLLFVLLARWSSFLWPQWEGTLHLTHLPLNKMITISQMTFPSAFSWMKSFEFHGGLFLRVQLTITHYWFMMDRRQTIIRTNADPIHWRTHAALGGNQLYIYIEREI